MNDQPWVGYVHRYDPGHEMYAHRAQPGHEQCPGNESPVPAPRARRRDPRLLGPGRPVHPRLRGPPDLPPVRFEGVPHGRRGPGKARRWRWRCRPHLLCKSSHDYRKPQIAISSDQGKSQQFTISVDFERCRGPHDAAWQPWAGQPAPWGPRPWLPGAHHDVPVHSFKRFP
jgi:hypothetical protein